MAKTNYQRVINEISSAITDYLDNYLARKAKFDKTFSATVVEKVSDNKYEVFYRGKKFMLSYNGTLSINQSVRVCAPQNNWNELFIVGIIEPPINTGERNIRM